MKAVHDLIWEHIMKTEQDSGILLGEEYLEFANKYGNQRDVANELLTIGRVYSCKGFVVSSNEYVHMSLDIAEAIRDSMLIGQCYSTLGNNVVGAYHFITAYKYLLKAISINKATGNKQFKSYDYGNLENICLALGMHKEAKSHWTKMQLLAIELDSDLTQPANKGQLLLF